MKPYKRIFDILFSIVILIITAPIILLISLGIILSDSGPVIFCSERIGCDGKVFTIYKFKSLKQKLSNINQKLVTDKNDYRMFWFGKILRRTHMDELPQFINVLIGDMSVVGPRPLPKLYREEKLKILPGITGLAQVRIENDKIHKCTYKLGFKYDRFYEKKYSIILDLYIILKTTRNVFLAKGI